MNAVDEETYDLTLEHLNSQLIEINKELNNENGKISNPEKMISQSLQRLTKLSTVWSSSDLNGKRILNKTLFPEGIFYHPQNPQYLTRNINRFVELVDSISKSCKRNKKGNSQKIFENSHSVARMGLEPITSGL